MKHGMTICIFNFGTYQLFSYLINKLLFFKIHSGNTVEPQLTVTHCIIKTTVKWESINFFLERNDTFHFLKALF